MSVNRKMDKQTALHIYNGLLLRIKDELSKHKKSMEGSSLHIIKRKKQNYMIPT